MSATSTQAKKRLRKAIAELFKAANVEELVAAGRTPFFAPALVRGPGVEFSAFVREVSPLGAGLLHFTHLEPGEVNLMFRKGSGGLLTLRIDIMWCDDWGEGWLASGGRFLDVVKPSRFANWPRFTRRGTA